MDANLVRLINDQMNFERYSAEIYLALSLPLEDKNLSGMAHWMYSQWQEENNHAKKFREYLLDRNELPELADIPKPPVGTNLPIVEMGGKAFLAAYEHELIVSARIQALYKEAERVGDMPTCEFLRWFILEQVEEEKKLVDILNLFTLAGGNGAAILELDSRLGER